MATTILLPATDYPHIAIEAGHEPHIQGHRIRVRDIVAARDLGGYTPEEIAGTVYSQLSLAEIYSALAYYEDHRSEIDAWQRRHSELSEDPIQERRDQRQ